MKNILKYPLVLLFAVAIIGVSAIDMLKPAREYSELENKQLAQTPTFTVQSFLENEFSPKFEQSVNDQFIMRDSWIDIKSRSEYLMGKLENNGIIFGSDGYLFEKLDMVDEDNIMANTSAIEIFAQKVDIPTTVAVVPSSSEILSDKLPQGVELVNQREYINKIYEQLDGVADTVDMYSALQSDEQVYYRTDHHWTAHGAWLGYNDVSKSLGINPIELDNYSKSEVTDFFGTYYSKSKAFGTNSDTINYYPQLDGTLTTPIDEYDSFYDLDAFETTDKYGAFLHGNNGVATMKSDVETSENEEKGKLLVVKDSYANALLPYISANYDEVVVVDLRYYAQPISALIEQEEITDVLVLYSFSIFASDTSLPKLVL